MPTLFTMPHHYRQYTPSMPLQNQYFCLFSLAIYTSSFERTEGADSNDGIRDIHY
jgi:hypothetical protein